MGKIYLSSTFKDLAEHRKAVYRVLRQMRHDVVSMEDYTASSRPPLEKCLADVDECDVYVGIFAWRYGYRPPGQDKAITELELRAAERAGKPCLIFILPDDASWPANLMDSGPDREAIDALRAELRRDYTVAFFRSPDELASAVSVAVANELRGADDADDVLEDEASQRFYQRSLSRLSRELGAQIRTYLMLSAAVVVAGVGIAIFGLIAQLLFVQLGGALVGTATVFPIATMLQTRRKKAVLDGYEEELTRQAPAPEAVLAVKRFFDRQMREQVFV